MANGPLDGKVALVTGAGSSIGMGRIIALALTKAGAHVAMLDVNADSLERVANEAREIADDNAIMAITADVSAWDDAVRSVETTIEGLGGLHILVNLAGVHSRTMLPRDAGKVPFWELPPEVWEKVVTINSTGPFLMARAAVGHMVDQGWGRIIGVTTSLDTMIRDIPYGPSKATHEALIAAMAPELEGTGVTANALLPGGAANTNFLFRDTGQDYSQLVQPEVMGPPAVWLSSDASADVTGKRIIAGDWDEHASTETNLAKAVAPAAWPQLGRRNPPPRQA